MLTGSRFQAAILCAWIVCLLLLALVSFLVEKDIESQTLQEKGVVIPSDN